MAEALLIKPEIGRTLHFHAQGCQPHTARAGAGGPLAAKIVHVHSDRMVNLTVWDANGNNFGVTSVELVHPDDAAEDRAGFFAAWMPWQVEQARNAKKFRESREKFLKACADPDDKAACVAKELGGVNPLDDLARETHGKQVEDLAKLAKEHGMAVTINVADDEPPREYEGCKPVATDDKAEETKAVDPRTLPGPGTESPKASGAFDPWAN